MRARSVPELRSDAELTAWVDVALPADKWASTLRRSQASVARRRRRECSSAFGDKDAGGGGGIHRGLAPPDGRPVLLVSFGSFSPPTLLHTRVLEEARAALERAGHAVLGGLMSPVHQAYAKKSLAPMYHRVNMVERAVAGSDWIACDRWECGQPGWVETADVLRRRFLCGAQYPARHRAPDGSPAARVMLVCGADLIESFDDLLPNGAPLWSEPDVRTIVSECGVVVITRDGTDIERLVRERLRLAAGNVVVVRPAAPNAISSTVVRRLVVAGESAQYLAADEVLDYVHRNELHRLPQWGYAAAAAAAPRSAL